MTTPPPQALSAAHLARVRQEIAEIVANPRYAVSYTLVIHELAILAEEIPDILATLDEETRKLDKARALVKEWRQQGSVFAGAMADILEEAIS